MSAGAGSSQRPTLGISRRNAPRFDVCPIPFAATWLSERRTINGVGFLLNISSGGFGARMVEAPVNGRLLHTWFSLPVTLGKAARPVETEARVCRRQPALDDIPPEWIVHFAIESIHPVDEKTMTQAIRMLQAASASSPG